MRYVMIKLPYFKFSTNEWILGNITMCSLESQGLFVNICAFYWSKECVLSFDKMKKRFEKLEDLFEELIENEVIKIENDFIKIDFLDAQLLEIESLSKKKSEAGKASAEARKSTRVEQNLTGVKQEVNTTQQLREDKIREDKIREDKIKKEFKSFIDWFNETFKRNFKPLDKLIPKFKKALEDFTFDELKQATKNAHNDKFHKENNYKYLTPEYIMRPDKIDKYLNFENKAQPIEKKINDYSIDDIN